MPNRILLSVLVVVAASQAKKPMTVKQWEKCRDKAESSVNQMEVGIWGVEAEIKSKCGEPPVQNPSALTGIIGMHPYDLVRTKVWKKKFSELTKSRYNEFIDRLAMADPTTLDDGWVVGKGFASHCAGSDEAAFAINIESGLILAIEMETNGNGTEFTKFGFSQNISIPNFLQTWLSERR